MSCRCDTPTTVDDSQYHKKLRTVEAVLEIAADGVINLESKEARKDLAKQIVDQLILDS